jgi:hypothetical protein
LICTASVAGSLASEAAKENVIATVRNKASSFFIFNFPPIFYIFFSSEAIDSFHSSSDEK